MRTYQRVGGFVLTALMIMSAGAAMAQKAPKRSITKIAGDVYRFQNNFHFSVFYVTPGGVLVTDPINAGAAKWLKAEIKKRFNHSIKYLVYSHDHQDHSSGGEVFADTATIVGHERTRAAMVGEKRPTPAPTVIPLGKDASEVRPVGHENSADTFGGENAGNLGQYRIAGYGYYLTSLPV